MSWLSDDIGCVRIFVFAILIGIILVGSSKLNLDSLNLYFGIVLIIVGIIFLGKIYRKS